MTSFTATAPAPVNGAQNPGGRAPAPFRGPAADSRLGELFIDVISIVCAHAHALDLYHARYICGATFRLGVRREDGSLDRGGFRGGTADMIAGGMRTFAGWLARARARWRVAGTQLMLSGVAEAGNERQVRALIAAGAPLNLVNDGGYTALHFAAWKGNVVVIEMLLNGKFEGGGANIYARDQLGWTALMRAIHHRHTAAVRLLLGRGAHIRYCEYGTDRRNALTLAERGLNAEIIGMVQDAIRDRRY